MVAQPEPSSLRSVASPAATRRPHRHCLLAGAGAGFPHRSHRPAAAADCVSRWRDSMIPGGAIQSAPWEALGVCLLLLLAPAVSSQQRTHLWPLAGLIVALVVTLFSPTPE